jgi:hypothetical protein
LDVPPRHPALRGLTPESPLHLRERD